MMRAKHSRKSCLVVSFSNLLHFSLSVVATNSAEITSTRGKMGELLSCVVLLGHSLHSKMNASMVQHGRQIEPFVKETNQNGHDTRVVCIHFDVQLRESRCTASLLLVSRNTLTKPGF